MSTAAALRADLAIARLRETLRRRDQRRRRLRVSGAIAGAVAATLAFGVVQSLACAPEPGRLEIMLSSNTPGAVVNRDGSLTCPLIRVLASSGSKPNACQVTIRSKGKVTPRTVTIKASLANATVEAARFTLRSAGGVAARFDQLPRVMRTWSGRWIGTSWGDTYSVSWTDLTNRSMGRNATLVFTVEAVE